MPHLAVVGTGQQLATLSLMYKLEGVVEKGGGDKEGRQRRGKKSSQGVRGGEGK